MYYSAPDMVRLPPVPIVDVEVLRSQLPEARGFTWVREVELRNRYADGSHSASYRYYFVERALLDAVCITLYQRGPEGPEIVLRSQLRPPLSFRGEYEVPVTAHGTGAVQWEVPAGLVELGERGEQGLFARAAAEALEEVGLRVPASRFSLLGHPTSLSPGLIAEKLHFVCAEIFADDERVKPEGDGHPVEEHSLSVFLPVRAALAALDEGVVHDIKTETAIRRLAARLGVG